MTHQLVRPLMDGPIILSNAMFYCQYPNLMLVRHPLFRHFFGHESHHFEHVGLQIWLPQVLQMLERMLSPDYPEIGGSAHHPNLFKSLAIVESSPSLKH